MSNLFDKYFKDKDISTAKASLIIDIKNNKISKVEIKQLIDEIDEHGMLNDYDFKRFSSNEWNEENLNFLSAGVAVGKFSKKYLLHLAEVSQFVNRKKAREKAIIIAVSVISIITIIIIVTTKIFEK